MLSSLMIAAASIHPVVAIADRPISAVDPIEVPGPRGARTLMVRVTAPTRGARLPVILLSHGNRLSREDYRPLVDWWAKAGYIVIQPDHADASTDGFPPSVNPPGMWQTRVEDMHRILDALPLILRQVPELAGRADTTKIALSGHSLGGLTAMMIGGARPKWDVGAVPIADRRVSALVLLAPTGESADMTPDWKARSPYVNVDFGTLRGPILLVAGGIDDAPPTTTGRGASWRQDAYRLSPKGTACMLVVAGANHYLGGINGTHMEPKGDARPERLQVVRETTVRFLDASLKGQGPSFRAWLPTQATQRAVESATCR